MLLQPKNRKYRKDQSGAGSRNRSKARAHRLAFGCYGLKALETPQRGHLKASQIEAVRRVIIRKVRKVGQI